MGRAAREKWNRRLRQLEDEHAERRRRHEDCAREEAEGVREPFSPSSFWADWFSQTAKAEGSAFVLRVLCNSALGGDASLMRAADWWPEPVDRADVKELKVRIQDVEDTRTGTAAVALVELLAEAIATRGLPMPGDSTADGFSAAIMNLAVAIRTEIELALTPPTR